MDPITAGIDLVTSAVNRIWPDAGEAQKNKIAFELAMVNSQTDTNRVEAASASIFVAGWRPFIGWTCGAAYATQFVAGPLASWAASLAGHPLAFPQLDLGTMMPLLLGMLGLGGMRTFEKINGVNAGH